MTYKMTPERQKLLTEMIGECWHLQDENQGAFTCKKCKKSIDPALWWNRTFTTDKDMMDVFRKLVDSEKWINFYDFALWRHTSYSVEDGDLFSEWLFYNPERFCCLVAMALKEGVI